jgi:hypothetical protein
LWSASARPVHRDFGQDFVVVVAKMNKFASGEEQKTDIGKKIVKAVCNSGQTNNIAILYKVGPGNTFAPLRVGMPEPFTESALGSLLNHLQYDIGAKLIGKTNGTDLTFKTTLKTKQKITARRLRH